MAISGDNSIENIRTTRARLVLKNAKKKKLNPVRKTKTLKEGLRKEKNITANTKTIAQRTILLI